MGLKRIRLRKDKDYVYCFKREKLGRQPIIEEKDCDFYEHNIECDKKHDVFGRTHRKGTLAGYRYHGESGNVLNSCKYCLDQEELYAEYIIPQDAKVNKNRGGLDDIVRWFK